MTEHGIPQIVDRVLKRLSINPKDLLGELDSRLPDDLRRGRGSAEIVALFVKHISATRNDHNDITRCEIERWLLRYDKSTGEWAAGTAPRTQQRRDKIYELLKLDVDQRHVITSNFPPLCDIFLGHDVALGWQDWFTTETKEETAYHSNSLLSYLREEKGWSEQNLLTLDQKTDDIIANIANPKWSAPRNPNPRKYASRGLVVGYVQSGKTTTMNMTIAKAVDVGYKLIIVLAGTTDLLRRQTQRRLDKEVVGKHVLQHDEEAANDGGYVHAPDWQEFIEHPQPQAGFNPRHIERLTTYEHDFTRQLGQQAFNLEYFNNPTTCKIIVIKKQANRLGTLVSQVRAMPEESRKCLSVLVLDDESDQAAAINLVKPKDRIDSNGEEIRKGINKRVMQLLQLLENAQYVGLTATPASNCFISPKNEKDMFPKDFILTLNRPDGYMGILDFHDIDEETLEPIDDPRPKKKAHVRDIEGPRGRDDQSLQHCLDSFVLAGALKLYRKGKIPGFTPKHHTLFHSDCTAKTEMRQAKQRIKRLWASSGYNSIKGLQRLQKLYENDFIKFSNERDDPNYFPTNFADLRPHISEAIAKIDAPLGQHDLVLLVNSDKDEGMNPNFEESSVWKIVVGGFKLSRGYTIEGLTVTYFRRKSLVASALMQMGRWFGYRAGYQDLVRLYVGKEPGRPDEIDVYKTFEGICIDEERLRRRFEEWYNLKPGGERITPQQLRPLVTVTGTRLLPAPKNHMHDIEIASMTFDHNYLNLKLDTNEKRLKSNERLWKSLLSEFQPDAEPRKLLIGANIRARFTPLIPHARMVEVLKQFQHSIHVEKHPLFLNFLEGPNCKVREWRVMLPDAPRRDHGVWSPLPGCEYAKHGRKWDMDLGDENERKKTLGAGAGSKERYAARALTTDPDTNPNLPTKLADLTPEVRTLHSPSGLGIIMLLPTTVTVGMKNQTPIMLYECEVGSHPPLIAFRAKADEN